MATFGDSFTREIGKNTGKAVSNIIFGDLHATPYRRVDSTRAKESEAKIEKIQKEQLFAIDNAVLKNIDAVATIRISSNKETLLDQLSELSTQLKANRWYDTFNSEEGKIRNKYSDALFEKYKHAVKILEKVAPNEPQLEYYQKVVQNTYWRKNLRKYSFILFCSLFFGILGLIVWIQSLNNKEQNILIITTISIAIISISLFIYFKIKNKSKTKKIKATETINQSQPIENETTNSIFIDLNENNRIEIALSKIWNRYKNSVNKNIISRKPIFSADGIKESILFIGINPSFNPNDDKVFIHGECSETLMYGSLYQLPNAPEYFKKLEAFSSKINIPYTHINLLYARENDREFLLSSDSNFIREQLELTYETIVKINPIAIVFFSDYCKNLIFGADRWVNPNSNIDDSFILNGTSFPVFFSEDITFINEDEQNVLIQKIKLRCKV